jgi:hypothetical protein
MTSPTTSLAVDRSLLRDESVLCAIRWFLVAFLESQCHCFDVYVKRCSDFECRKILSYGFRNRLGGSGKKYRHLVEFSGKFD